MALHENGMKMPKVVRKFTKKVTEVVLDNLGSDVGQITMEGQEFISGSSSINAVIRKVVPLDVDEDGTKRLGTFVPRGNGAGNPIAEIAAFNLALIFGQPKLVRPAVRAEMDVKASYQFKKNWEAFLGRRSRLRRNELKMDNAVRAVFFLFILNFLILLEFCRTVSLVPSQARLDISTELSRPRRKTASLSLQCAVDQSMPANNIRFRCCSKLALVSLRPESLCSSTRGSLVTNSLSAVSFLLS